MPDIKLREHCKYLALEARSLPVIGNYGTFRLESLPKRRPNLSTGFPGDTVGRDCIMFSWRMGEFYNVDLYVRGLCHCFRVEGFEPLIMFGEVLLWTESVDLTDADRDDLIYVACGMIGLGPPRWEPA